MSAPLSRVEFNTVIYEVEQLVPDSVENAERIRATQLPPTPPE